MGKRTITLSVALLMLGSWAIAENHVAPHDGPCKQIHDACTGAGFIQGDGKDGKGLWMDCIDPIMQGTTAKKSVLPLPTVSAAQITACRQQHPKFGAGKVGN